MKGDTKNFTWLDVPKTVWYFLSDDRKKFSIYFIILTLIFLYELVPAYMVGKMVDFFSKYKTGDSLTTFYFYVLFISVTWVIASQIRLKSKNVVGICRQHARTKARIWGFERLTEFSLEWHNKENTGNKLQRIFTGGDAIASFMKMVQKDLLYILVSTIGVIIFFAIKDIRLAFFIIIYISIFLYIEYFFSKKVYNLSNQYNALNQQAAGTHVESASNMLSIKALGGEAGIIQRVSNREILSRDISIERINTNNLKWRTFQFINGITMGIAIYLIGSNFLSGAISIGMVLVLFTYFNKLVSQMGDISELHVDLIENKSDIGQMMPIFRETEFIKTGNESFPKGWDKIEIKNAKMDYGSGQMGLEDFSLVLKRNIKTGIAGLSGSGKSTLAKIILGLYALKSGEFKIGSKNYYSINHNETLSHVTVVLQETELFNLSLRDNITMMRGDDSELLTQAVKISQLEEVINRLPEGLNALVGEKGYMLSGGERQRLGIARAIYKNAPIVIMDEATSSLDSETEGKIMEKLLGEYGQEKTFLIIAHRLGTLRYTDNIAVMERGQVVEEGNYTKLMSDTKSVFYRMNKESTQEAKIVVK